ncbi:hypothetical protein EB796_001533 [Bugula neritina]|uniref:Uncharacterized protein n=1 Tax=Bugula neritina TaxID=10212 RepID=A0A7J7KPQ3_BUGNE|nr:hypothetical protein EB796_001533 [Bugula neritina]
MEKRKCKDLERRLQLEKNRNGDLLRDISELKKENSSLRCQPLDHFSGKCSCTSNLLIQHLLNPLLCLPPHISGSLSVILLHFLAFLILF